MRRIRRAIAGVGSRGSARVQNVEFGEFNGDQMDPESELLYADARFYDPSQAQFLPLASEEAFVNPYASVGLIRTETLCERLPARG